MWQAGRKDLPKPPSCPVQISLIVIRWGAPRNARPGAFRAADRPGSEEMHNLDRPLGTTLVERKAFTRAWRFLNYHPGAKWSAMCAAVATGVIYIGMLVVLGLFADLIVNHGRIPAYANLSARAREDVEQEWDRSPPAQRQAQLVQIGLVDDTARRLSQGGAGDLGSEELDLLWRSQVVDLLAHKVNGTAAALVLPDYHLLSPADQREFVRAWAKQPTAEQQAQLTAAGLEPPAAMALAATPSAKLTAEQQALLWRGHLVHLANETFGARAANAFLTDRVRLANGRTEVAPQQELADRGLLSLVVRMRHHLAEPAVSLLARAMPWTWKAVDGKGRNFLIYLIGLMAMALVLAFLQAIVTFGMHYAAAVATIEASTRLRRAIYHHTYRLGTLAFRALGPSEAVGVFTGRMEAVHEGLYSWLTVVCKDRARCVLLLIFALALDWRLAVPFLLLGLLVWLVGGQVAVHFRQQERRATRRAADHLALLQESLMMMRLVKVYLMELFNQARVERQLAALDRLQMQRSAGQAMYRPFLAFLGTLAGVIILFLAGFIVLQGSMSVATAITLATALVSLYWPLVSLIEQRRALQRARDAAGVVFAFLDRPHDVGQAVGAEFLAPMSRKLDFDDVSLREPGTGRMLLDHVSMSIPAGQRVALVGAEDMEKHALVYLIPRFLDPGSGEIRLDGRSLRWVTLDSLRAQIAMVMQHNLVFNDTVANNIGCGDASYDRPKIIEAAKMAHAHHFIQKLPKGYETPIGDLGHRLTISQQYRIALARAILRDPALLIIEEPVQPLDDDTKDLVDDTLTRFLPGRTAIFLPHRISTIRGCDQVFLLHKGHIEAAGEHRALLSQNNLYRHLQYIEFNEFAEVG